LIGACMNRSDCTDTETCREGVCVDEQVDGTTLPPFEPSGAQVTTVECGASIFQDTSTHSQIVGDGGKDTGGAPECNGGQCIEGTCYLPPQGSSATPNHDGGAVKTCNITPEQCTACQAQGGGPFCQMSCVAAGCPDTCCGGGTGGAPDMGSAAFDAGTGGSNPYGGACVTQADCQSSLTCRPSTAGGMVCTRMCTMPGATDTGECPPPSTGFCSLQGF